MMTPDTIERYQYLNDIWVDLQAQYGTAVANDLADIAATGAAHAVNAALVKAKYGAARETSTGKIFAEQILTDPLAAPADALNSQLGKAFKNFFKSPWIVLAAVLVGVGAFLYFAGNPFKKSK